MLITVPSAVNLRKRLAVLLGRTNLPRFESYYWYPGPWRGHIREYTKGDLRLLSQCLGLRIVELKSCDHMLQLLPPFWRPLYLAITAVLRDCKDSWLLLATKDKGWKPTTLTRTEVSSLLERYGGAY